MSSMIENPALPALFMSKYLIPYCRQYDIEYTKNIIMNPSLLSEKIEDDSIWLAKVLSGK